MAAIPALDSACHHALTLIGLICYSFPSALEGFLVHSALMSAGKISSSLSFIRVPRFHTKITALSLTTSRFGVEGN